MEETRRAGERLVAELESVNPCLSAIEAPQTHSRENAALRVRRLQGTPCTARRSGLPPRSLRGPRNLPRQIRAALTIQSWYRSLSFRRIFRITTLRIRAAIRISFRVQAWFRGYCARKYVQKIRHARRVKHASVLIQARYRGFLARRRARGLAMEKRRNELYTALREMRDIAPIMLPEPWGGYQRDFAQGEDVTGHVKHDAALGILANIDLSVPQLSQEQDFNYAIQRLGQVTSKKPTATVVAQHGPRRSSIDLRVPHLALSSNPTSESSHLLMDLSIPQLSQEQVDELFAFNKCLR